MNERIKQLYDEAVNYTATQDDGTKNQLQMNHICADKFAELIVGHATECVRDVLREEDSDLSYTAATQVQNKIKQFFGVEE